MIYANGLLAWAMLFPAISTSKGSHLFYFHVCRVWALRQAQKLVRILPRVHPVCLGPPKWHLYSYKQRWIIIISRKCRSSRVAKPRP